MFTCVIIVMEIERKVFFKSSNVVLALKILLLIMPREKQHQERGIWIKNEVL